MSETQAAATPAPIPVNVPTVKPFDVADLLGRYKKNGLTAAEAALKVIATNTLDWLSEGCALKGGKLKYLAPLFSAAKPKAVELIDKLDGIKN